jgi:hypothetical protein
VTSLLASRFGALGNRLPAAGSMIPDDTVDVVHGFRSIFFSSFRFAVKRRPAPMLPTRQERNPHVLSHSTFRKYASNKRPIQLKMTSLVIYDYAALRT